MTNEEMDRTMNAYPTVKQAGEPTPASPPREREVPSALGKIAFALDQLDAASDKLWVRLAPVIRQVPAEDPKERKEEMVGAPLAMTLDGIAERILKKQRELTALEERIQI